MIIRNSDQNKRNQIISIRCMETDKSAIENKAKKVGKTTSEYVLDCAIAGLERRKDRDRKRVVKMIEVTELMNQICSVMEKKLQDENVSDVRNLVENMKKEVAGLWQY